MPSISFVDHEGASRPVEAEVGHSLMEAARDYGIPGIVAQCGGMCACATCHVYVEKNFLDQLPPPDECEEVLLDFLDDREENSRLSCQIVITAEMAGMIVTTPASQG